MFSETDHHTDDKLTTSHPQIPPQIKSVYTVIITAPNMSQRLKRLQHINLPSPHMEPPQTLLSKVATPNSYIL